MWLNEEFRNPVDGKVYVAPGGWQTYTASASGEDDNKKTAEVKRVPLPIELSGVVLLTPEQQIESIGLSADILAEFVKEISSRIEKVVGKLRSLENANNKLPVSIFETHIQVQIRPGSVASFTITTVPEGKLSSQEITAIEQSLSHLAIPIISRDTVSFVLSFNAKIPSQ